MHHLVLTGAAPDALSGDLDDFTAALAAHEDEIRRRIRQDVVQTNEVQRCVALLPAFLTVARETALPVELLELGPSAGLNLLVDRYRYAYAEGTWGGSDALLELVADERGRPVPAELLATGLDVRRRRGIDLAPVDATTEEGYLLLRSFVWPGLEDRVRRLDAAVATLRAEPERPRADPGRLRGATARQSSQSAPRTPSPSSSRRPRRATCPRMRPRGSGRRSTRPASDGRPLAWVSTRRHDEREGAVEDAYELELRVWPGPPRLAAHLDFHGNWLEWLLP